MHHNYTPITRLIPPHSLPFHIDAPTAMQSPFHHHTATTTREAADHNDESPKWASRLLRDCARAIADKDSSRIHHLLWALNELSSPYGDLEQRLASHFLQALFCRATDSGRQCHRVLSLAAERSRSFDATLRVLLRLNDLAPFMAFGHAVSNAAILDALHDHPNTTALHIVDMSSGYCTQWPTLLEVLASRTDADAPSVRLTVVPLPPAGRPATDEAAQRMARFAKLMGVPMDIDVVTTGAGGLAKLTRDDLRIEEGEAVAVSCSGALRAVEPSRRTPFLKMLASLEPRMVTVVEEEADLTYTGGDFMRCFQECLRFYTLALEMLDESFGETSNERLALERECARGIIGALACDDVDVDGGCGKRERGRQWRRRLAGVMTPVGLSEDVVEDVEALLKRYSGGWSVEKGEGNGGGLYLRWKEEPLVWASAWKL